MFDWWDVLSSVSRVHAWAQYLTVFFLMLGASSMVLTFKSSSRINELKGQAAVPTPAEAKPAAKVPAPPAKASTGQAKAPATAEEAKLKAEQAQKRANERHLSSDEKGKLASLLAGRPKGSVSVTYVANDAEAQAYCQELVKVLHTAGWKVSELGPASDSSNPKGLHFQIKNVQNEPENAKYLIHSFIEVGFKPVTELNKVVPDLTLVLVVGHKP